jgi:hypothetical protein
MVIPLIGAKTKRAITPAGDGPWSLVAVWATSSRVVRWANTEKAKYAQQAPEREDDDALHV